MIATGTGLAPYIAMLRSEEVWKSRRKIIVVHGARLHSDLAYADELNAYQAKYPDQFRYDYVVSCEQTNAAGQKMFIQTKMAAIPIIYYVD